MDFRDKVVVVTGAASGIGREMALTFARRGARLAIVDIDEPGLQGVRDELAGMDTEVHVHVVDVSRADEVEALCENVYRDMGRVDVLCNNAGVIAIGNFEDAALEDLEWMVGVNLRGVIHGCHFFYPRMVAQGGGGHIVNTASGAGLAPLPFCAAYCCTKYAVVGLSETLRAEAALHGIGVSAICPAVVSTNFARTAKLVSGTNRSTPGEMQEWLERVYERINYTPDRVAAVAVRAVERNRGVVPVGSVTYLGDWTHRISRRLNDAMLVRVAKIFLKWL
ncbi:MAG: SDR family NAD(P)-dependent oxidoreductase [Actinobacteria bacterium]|nr:SDR family NAD(P)-dependent oxidoreductase [Actinomycetota bacterium]